MNKPIYYIKEGKLSFGNQLLFQDLNMHLYPKDRVCLIGRNGCGKSSLMKSISGVYELDSGETYIAPKITIGYLPQSEKYDRNSNVYDFVLMDIKSEDEDSRYLADIILDKLYLDGNKLMGDMSGGQVRRAFLARSLISAPDILLLDEPTNHLDITSIEWLENYLQNYNGSVICISHDRAFLSNVTNKMWWLDRATLRQTDKGFEKFEEWEEEIEAAEALALEKMNKKIAVENVWLNQGVTARRKRNQRRLQEVFKLREKFKKQQSHIQDGNKKLNMHELDEKIKSRLILDCEDVSFAYPEQAAIIKNFNMRIIKGEKIGLIGPNGSGKTTLIKMLAQQLQPTDGEIKFSSTLQLSYFDQHKSDLKMEDTMWETLCPGGGDRVFLPNGRAMHVAAYLKNFMFDPKLVNAKVGTLSGGEQSRLMLAKILANPGNFLILDEPTNDLDMESLENLYEILADYKGALLVVSHDRDFLNRLVSRMIRFTDEKEIYDYIGGYDDFKQIAKKKKPDIKKEDVGSTGQNNIKPKINNKLSYKYVRALEKLPAEIEQATNHITNLEQKLSDPELFTKSPEKFQKLTDKLESTKVKITEMEQEWMEAMEESEKYS